MPVTIQSKKILDKKRGVLTTSASTTTIDFAMSADSTTAVICKIALRATGGIAQGGFIYMAASIVNSGGVTSMDGSTNIITPILGAQVAGSTATLTATGGDLRLSVTSIVSDELFWMYELELITN